MQLSIGFKEGMEYLLHFTFSNNNLKGQVGKTNYDYST
jgi:hypothetical protein